MSAFKHIVAGAVFGIAFAASAIEATDFLRESIKASDRLSSEQKEALLPTISSLGVRKAGAGAACGETIVVAMASVHAPNNAAQTNLEQKSLENQSRFYWIEAYGRTIAEDVFPKDFPPNLKTAVLRFLPPKPRCRLSPPPVPASGKTPQGDLFLIAFVPIDRIQCDRKQFLSEYRAEMIPAIENMLLEGMKSNNAAAVTAGVGGLKSLGVESGILATAEYLVALRALDKNARRLAEEYDELPEACRTVLMNSLYDHSDILVKRDSLFLEKGKAVEKKSTPNAK